MCKDKESLSTAPPGRTTVQEGRGVPARARDVGEELAGMTKRKRGDGEDICCGGLARPHVDSNSLCAQQDKLVATCGAACGEGGCRRGDVAAKEEQDPESPQNSCSVADGILMRQTKKQRIMRRRVSFCAQSSMRLVSRDLMLAQYFVEGTDVSSAGHYAGAGQYEEEQEVQEVQVQVQEEQEQEVQEQDVPSSWSDTLARDSSGTIPEDKAAVEAHYHDGDDEVQASNGSTDGGSQTSAREGNDEEACDAASSPGKTVVVCGMEGSGEQAGGGDAPTIEDEGAEEFEDEEPELDDSKVVTKTNDGPSLTNVMSQALIMGLVERQVRDVGDVLRTLRRCVVPDCFEPPAEAEAEADELTESELAASSSDEDEGGSDDSSSEVRRRCTRRRWRRGPVDPRMILDSSVFDDAHTHIGELLDRINNNGRASLLPSTAQIGPPFVPALEFLLLSTKEAHSLNEQDRARAARMSAAAEGEAKPS